MSKGVELIAIERKRQIEELGYDVKHDNLYGNYQLSDAAICYASDPNRRNNKNEQDQTLIEAIWPWSKKHWKPSPKDRIRELQKAGALIAAQIDREIHILNNPDNDKVG